MSLAEKGAKCAEGAEGGQEDPPVLHLLIAVQRGQVGEDDYLHSQISEEIKPNAIALAEFWLTMRSTKYIRMPKRNHGCRLQGLGVEESVKRSLGQFVLRSPVSPKRYHQDGVDGFGG